MNLRKYLQNQARLRWWSAKLGDRRRHEQRDRLTGQRAHHWEEVHLREGRPDLAAINKAQIEAIRPHIAAWTRAVAEAAAQVHKYRVALERERPKPPPSAIPPGEGWCVPATVWNPYRRKIANWIAREIEDAVRHGAEGIVTSGVRTWAEQLRLWLIYLAGGNIAARPGQSNHRGYIWPLGAVDWNKPESLNAALLRKAAHKLLWAVTHGLRDTVHFSATGR